MRTQVVISSHVVRPQEHGLALNACTQANALLLRRRFIRHCSPTWQPAPNGLGDVTSRAGTWRMPASGNRLATMRMTGVRKGKQTMGSMNALAAASVPNVHSGLHTIVSVILFTSCSLPTGRRGRLSTVLMLVLFRVGMTSLLSVDLRVRATASRGCAPCMAQHMCLCVAYEPGRLSNGTNTRAHQTP